MSIEKMKLISFIGKTNKLEKIFSKCLINGNFDIEQASEHIGMTEILSMIKGSDADIKVDDILAYSSHEGKFNPSQAVQYMTSVLGYNSSSGENPYAAVLQSVRELATEFGYNIEEEGYELSDAYSDEDFSEYVDSVLEKVKELNSERNDLLEQLAECENGIKQFENFIGFDIPLEEVKNSEFVTTRFGHMPKESVDKLQLAYSENPYVLFVPCKTDAAETWGAYVAPNNRLKEVDKIFAALHFERLRIPEAVGSTQEIVDNLKKNIAVIEDEIKSCEDKINSVFENEKGKLKSIFAQFSAKNLVYEMRKYTFIVGSSFYCVGWVPAKKVRSIVSKLESFKGVEVTVSSPEDVPEFEPPVRLKNPKIFSPYEYYVEMYGLPKYHDMDITFFVAMMYTFVFGAMFGDVGQGILLAIGGFLAWKLKKIELGKILVPCGIASMVGGFVFGSVFGFEEALDPVYHALGMSHKPVEVMESVNGVLVFAVFTGVFLMFCAMLMHTVISFKRKDIGEALFSQNGITGMIFYSAGVSAVYSFMGGPAIIPKPVLIPMFAVSILILFFKEILIKAVNKEGDIKPESILDFVLQNVFECILYVLEYFSNTLSFLRVGAFVIVHASMMMVVFTLAGDPHTVKGIIVVILGNIVVIALEGLLTGIQGLRLVFYEMFSRFHEGGGKRFKAITSFE